MVFGHKHEFCATLCLIILLSKIASRNTGCPARRYLYKEMETDRQINDNTYLIENIICNSKKAYISVVGA